MFRRLLSFLFIVASSINLAAQAPNATFRILDGSKGLSQNSVYSIFQDSKGFLWIGTAEGLDRYDGAEVKVYKPQDGKTPPFFIRDQMFEDPQHNIWFGNADGIWKLDAAKNILSHKVGTGDYSLIPLSLSSEGYCYIFDVNKGIIRYKTETGESSLASFPFNIEAKRIDYASAVGIGDFCWVKMYNDDGLWQYNTRNNTFSHFLAQRMIRSVATDGHSLWAASGKELLKLDSNGQILKTITFSDASILGKVSVVNDGFGHLWIGTNGRGLMLFDTSGKLLRTYQSNHFYSGTLPSDFVTSLFIDQGRNLWIGTDGGGIASLDLKPATFGKFPESALDYRTLPDFFITSLYEDSLSQIWFGTLTGSLNRYNPKTGNLRTFPAKNAPVRIHHIYPQSDGSLLLSRRSGISIFKDGQFSSIPISFPKDFSAVTEGFNVNAIITLSPKLFLAASTVGLLQIAEKNGIWETHTIPIPGFGYDMLRAIIPAPGLQNFWVAIQGKGLAFIHVDANQVSMVKRLFQDKRITMLHQDSRTKNILWAGTAEGLLKLNVSNETMQKYGIESGLRNEHIYGIEQDANNNIWISTNAGLSRLSANDRIDNFTQENGLQSNEFNGGVSCKNPQTGRLCFGGIKGFNFFTTNSFGTDSFRAHAAIVETKINEAPTPDSLWTKGIPSFSHFQNAFSFQLAALDFTRPEANKIQYWLEGWDKAPLIAKPGIVRYANLPPGHYVFHARAAGNNQLFGEEIIRPFQIVPPFWKRDWFYFLEICVLISFVGFFFYSIGQRKLRKAKDLLTKQELLEEERRRISRDLHDELGGALTQISLLSSLIPMKKKSDEELKKDVGTIASIARGVTKSMGDIIWTLHPQDDSLAATLSYIREQSVDFLSASKLHYDIDFPTEIPEQSLTGEQRRNLLLVTKEGLNNALKHATAEHLQLKCFIENHKLCFEISDDGKGFSEKEKRVNSNGCMNMQARMKQIGGTVEWIQPGLGTCLKYSLPLT